VKTIRKTSFEYFLFEIFFKDIQKIQILSKFQIIEFFKFQENILEHLLSKQSIREIVRKFEFFVFLEGSTRFKYPKEFFFKIYKKKTS
jgi:hypothetical protein